MMATAVPRSERKSHETFAGQSGDRDWWRRGGESDEVMIGLPVWFMAGCGAEIVRYWWAMVAKNRIQTTICENILAPKVFK